jgi:hypothetical protein
MRRRILTHLHVSTSGEGEELGDYFSKVLSIDFA